MQAGGVRSGAVERWWSGLSGLDRERARYFAANGDKLPRGLFLGLCDANVLTTDSGHRAMVVDGSGPTLPMPADVRAYVRYLSVASPDPWPIAMDGRASTTPD